MSAATDPLAATAQEAARRERACRWRDAYECYCQLLHQSVRAGRTATLVGALLGSARMLFHLGNRAATEEIAEAAEAIAELGGLTAEQSRALNLRAVLAHERKDLAAARTFYLRATDLAREIGADELIAAATQNLGVISNALGDVREARALYLEAIGACVRSNSAAQAGTAYNNLGLASADLGEWTEAEVHFLRGIEIAERLKDLGLQARILTGRAEPLVRTGEFERARRSLDEAEEIASEIGDHKSLADVQRFRAMGARLQGDLNGAEELVELAVQIARGAGLELEEAEALEELAHLRESQGRIGAARVVLRESRRLYESLGARRDVERVEALAAEWKARPGALAAAGGAG